jgi:hypothetical protein
LSLHTHLQRPCASSQLFLQEALAAIPSRIACRKAAAASFMML